MFADEPSPFKPPPTRHWELLAPAALLLAAWGVYTYVATVTASNAVRASLPAPPTRSAPSEPAAPPRTEMLVAPPSPEPVAARGSVDPSARATIYLCKSYSGQSFWSDTACGAQRATIDRITTVPARLSFDQQVAIAQGEAIEAAALYAVPAPMRPAAIEPAPVQPGRSPICGIYDRQVRDLDEAAGRPLPAYRQDQIRMDRMNVMSARARERC